MEKIVILGAGIAGIGAGYYLKKQNKKSIIYEKNSSYGGLCDNFTVSNFRFDKFIHLSFTSNQELRKLYDNKVESVEHIPNAYNYYKGYWLKHPAQNNLYPLNEEEKINILTSFLNRKDIKENKIENYEEWLRVQYGDYFSENFPMIYTRKYWGEEAKNLETKWIGNRMYKPTIDEIKRGMETEDTPITYYAKKMYYPKKNGFKAYLEPFAKELDIKLNHEVIKIDTKNKIIYFKNNHKIKYEKLISSLPLPEIIKLLENVPKKIINESKKLKWTSGYMVSIGLKNTKIPNYLWFYIYDEEIPFSRVYSPSLKSSNNCPKGCSSIQAEIYFKNDSSTKINEEELLNRTIENLIKMNVIKEENIIVKDIKFEKYANIIFDFNIYEVRKEIRDYLNKIGIETIGRFGEWDYLWSDQSFLSYENQKGKNEN